MTKKISMTRAHKDLIRRYLLWFFKTSKESFERIERKTTQLKVDEYVLENINKAQAAPKYCSKEYDELVMEFEAYIKMKKADELKLKFSDSKGNSIHPQYLYLKNRLLAVEAAIRHFLGEKELRDMRALYENEFTTRILQVREH